MGIVVLIILVVAIGLAIYFTTRPDDKKAGDKGNGGGVPAPKPPTNEIKDR